MSNKNEVVVWVGCDDSGTRDLFVTAVENQLEHYTENCDSLKILSSPLRAASLLEVMDDYRPGFFDRFVKQVGEDASNTITINAIENLGHNTEVLSQKVEKFSQQVRSLTNFEEILPDLLDKKEVKESLTSIAQDKHRLEVTRHILASDRTDDVKVEELKHILDPNVSMKGKPQDVQAVVEMALYGQMPEGSTNAELRYKKEKDGIKTIGTF